MKIQVQLQTLKNNHKTLWMLWWLNCKRLCKTKLLWILTTIILGVDIYFINDYATKIESDLSFLGVIWKNNYFLFFNVVFLHLWMFIVCERIFADKTTQELMQLELKYGYTPKMIFFVRFLNCIVACLFINMILLLISLCWLSDSTTANSWYFSFVSKQFLWYFLILSSTSLLLISVIIFGGYLSSVILWLPLLVVLPSICFFTSNIVNNKLFKTLNNNSIIVKNNAQVNLGYLLHSKFKNDENIWQIFSTTDFANKIEKHFFLKDANFYSTSIIKSNLYQLFFTGDIYTNSNYKETFALIDLNPTLFQILDDFAKLVEQNSEKDMQYNAFFTNISQSSQQKLPTTTWLTNILSFDQSFKVKYGTLFYFLDQQKDFYYRYLHVIKNYTELPTNTFVYEHSDFRIYANLLTTIWVYAMQNPFTNKLITIQKKGPVLSPGYGNHPLNYKDYQTNNKINALNSFLNPSLWANLRTIPINNNLYFNDVLLNKSSSKGILQTSWNLSSIAQQINDFQNEEYTINRFNFDIKNSYFAAGKIKPKQQRIIWMQLFLVSKDLIIGIIAFLCAYQKFLKKIQN